MSTMGLGSRIEAPEYGPTLIRTTSLSFSASRFHKPAHLNYQPSDSLDINIDFSKVTKLLPKDVYAA
jgi:hypothetical protein